MNIESRPNNFVPLKEESVLGTRDLSSTNNRIDFNYQFPEGSGIEDRVRKYMLAQNGDLSEILNRVDIERLWER